MQALGNFIIDDDTIDCRRLQPVGQQTPVDSDRASSERDRTLGALLHEIETTGTLIACAASVVNHAAINAEHATRLFASLPVWLPSPPPLMSDGASALIRAGLPLLIINRLHSLRVQLGVATEAARRHSTAVAASRPVADTAVGDLVALWRVLSENAVELLREVRALAPTGPESATAASAETLLAAATLGAWPCVGANGLIEIPGWIERRTEGRHRFRFKCKLVVDGREWPVETVDISRDGTGLAGLPQLRLGTKAVLRMGRLTEITGSIVWSSGHQGGFRFDQPLASVADLAHELFPF